MQFLEGVPLSDHVTFRLGGAARFFVTVTSTEELRDALKLADTRKLPVFILGGGSNVLFSDGGWPGLVVRIAISGTEYTENTRGDARLTAGAGVVWDTLVADTVSQGLWGMENLSHIPGTVGATPVQNVGAYGVEVCELIDWVEVLDRRTYELHILPTSECAFGYRDSLFKHAAGAHFIVTRVAYRLTLHANPKLSYRDLHEHFGTRTDVSAGEVRDALGVIRGAKFPDLARVGTAGSFFKNPVITYEHHRALTAWFGVEPPAFRVDDTHVKVPLAWLLERCGWKGKRVGTMGCWSEQPLVVVHYGNGSADELLRFVREVAADIKHRADIMLEPEVCIVEPPVPA